MQVSRLQARLDAAKQAGIAKAVGSKKLTGTSGRNPKAALVQPGWARESIGIRRDQQHKKMLACAVTHEGLPVPAIDNCLMKRVISGSGAFELLFDLESDGNGQQVLQLRMWLQVRGYDTALYDYSGFGDQLRQVLGDSDCIALGESRRAADGQRCQSQ